MSSRNNTENIDKFRLINLVYNNSILWDSRLPNFKRAGEAKLAGWTEIGEKFKIPPQSAERCFKRLRETFRKELIKQKKCGDSFRSSWEFFDAIYFLRPIIKERKSGLYRDLKIPVEDYAFYIGQDHGNRNSSANDPSEMVNTTMTEIPIEIEITEIDAKPKLANQPLKRCSSLEGSSSCYKDSRSDLHEKFGNLITSKLNTLDDIEADTQMNNIIKLLFN
ncbi:Mes2 family protein [Megaselia abdita]